MDFIYHSRPARVVFGAGTIEHVEREVAALGAKRALVLSTPDQRAMAEGVAQRLGRRAAGVFDGAVMHVPVEAVRDAIEVLQQTGADCTVAVGGGSTTGLAKAIALQTSLPILAIPTTFAGSEMTSIHGMTEGRLKATGRDERVVPRTVVYDPDLVMSLPVPIAVSSGLNAIAHAAEGLYAHDGNPVVNLMAEEGIRALAGALPRIHGGEPGAAARTEALYGAWLCGAVLGSVAMGLHHKLCHTLGGTFNLPHAETHAVMLPHTLAYNAPAASAAMQKVARALGCADAPRGVYDLLGRTGSTKALRDIGMPEGGLDEVARLAVQSPYPNPRPLERTALRELLQRAFDGAAPA